MPTPESADLHVLGIALRRRRKAAGLTLEGVADHVGVTAGQLSRIETGKSQPSYETLVRLQHVLDPEVSGPALPVPRPLPDDGLIPRLGALLTVRRKLSLGDASLLLGASIAGIRVAVAELAERLAPMGMLVVEDGDVLGLVPHRAFVDLADRATAAVTTPKLTGAHLEILGIVLNAGAVTCLGFEQARGLDSTEVVAQLVEWGLLRREGAVGRWPLYRGTAKLVEVTGMGSMEELRATFTAAVRDAATVAE